MIGAAGSSTNSITYLVAKSGVWAILMEVNAALAEDDLVKAERLLLDAGDEVRRIKAVLERGS